jgi:hypothetical protein
LWPNDLKAPKETSRGSCALLRALGPPDYAGAYRAPRLPRGSVARVVDEARPWRANSPLKQLATDCRKKGVKNAKIRKTSTKKKMAPDLPGAGRKSHVDWREETLARVRALIREADPQIVEDIKWRKPSNAMKGVPVWSRDGIICTGETYKDKVKLTFAKGAALSDAKGLFNASLDGGVRRAIDIREGERVDGKALVALVRAAAALNAKSVRKAKAVL